jgi:hypothetical protein
VPLLIAAGIAVLVVLAGVAFWWSARADSGGLTVAQQDPTPGGQLEPTTGQPTDVPIETPIETPTDTPIETPIETPSDTPTESPSSVLDERGALQQLQDLRDATLQSVQLDGRWVAQLASKYVGLTDPKQVAANGSHTFYAVDILDQHNRLRRGVGDSGQVILLLSTDYGKRQLVDGKALWVTFAIHDFGGEDEVRQWCQLRFPNSRGARLENNCTPRRLAPPQ